MDIVGFSVKWSPDGSRPPCVDGENKETEKVVQSSGKLEARVCDDSVNPKGDRVKTTFPPASPITEYLLLWLLCYTPQSRILL